MRCLRRSIPLLLSAVLLGGCANLPLWMVLQARSSITDHLHFDNAPIAAAPRPSALPVAPHADLILPGPLAGETFEARLEKSDTVAFLVVQGGRVVYERYFHGFWEESLVTSFSIAKSVVSMLVGIALHEGSIAGIDDPVTRYLPELGRQDARFAGVTLRHLLEMRSGIAFDEGSRTPWGDPARFYLTRDLAAQVRGLRIERPAGEVYRYSNGDTQVLAMALERAVGMPLARYMQERLWQPMGAAFGASWSLDSDERGTPKAFCCLNARARDYARLGLLFLRQGRLGGRQVVPAGWVERSTAVHEHPGRDEASRWSLDLPGKPGAAFYTWSWRRHPVAAPGTPLGLAPGPSFYAKGLHGQYIFVAPEQDMVIVRLGMNHGAENWPELLAELAALNPARSDDRPAQVAGH